jgi:hypothetical protein
VKHGEYALLYHVSLAERHLCIDKHLEVITHSANTIETPCLRQEKGTPEITEILYGPMPESPAHTADRST